MQPWTEKASGSNHTNSLYYDKTLSHLNNMSSQQQSSNSSSSSGFRTIRDIPPPIPSDFESTTNSPDKQSLQYNFKPTYTNYQESMSLSDGAEVMSFLNTISYSDHIHGDDLRPDSMSYISHRHQLDTQHGLAEREKLQELFISQDIVEYLKNVTYSDDIYGIPILGNLIKEAQKEVKDTSQNQQIAVNRLSMIRNHLVQKAQGDFELAAQNAFRMKENDWSTTFFDSSI